MTDDPGLDHLRGRLSLVLPALNEAAPLATLLGELARIAAEQDWELVVVDDGSTDGTHDIAGGGGATVLRHERTRGYGAALKSGIRATTREYVAFMDADGQHTVGALRSVLGRAGDADMVVGGRAGLSATRLWRRPGKWFLLRLADYIARERIPDLNSGLRVTRRVLLLRYMHLCPEGFSFTTTLTLALLDRGRSVLWVPISVEPSRSRSTVSVATGFETILLILRLATLFQPLRLFVTASLTLIAAGLAWSVPYALDGRGISIGAALLVIAGVQLLFTGLLADQIATFRKERFE